MHVLYMLVSAIAALYMYVITYFQGINERHGINFVVYKIRQPSEFYALANKQPIHTTQQCTAQIQHIIICTAPQQADGYVDIPQNKHLRWGPFEGHI